MWKTPGEHAKYQRDRYHKRASLVRQIKAERGCYQCGENRLACLSLHHRDQETKRFSFGSGAMSNTSLETFAREVAGCEVLCHNCHQLLHDNERLKAN